MKPEQINTEIAKLMGWNKTGLERDSWYWTKIPLEIYFKLSEEERIKQRTCVLPNYSASLDACAEFENQMDEQQYRMFVSYLVQTLKPGEFSVRAPAIKRCEAFLRLHGKWEE